MLTLRTLAIVITGAGLFAGLPLTKAQACDDDRYPCPVRSQVLTQETADEPAQPAPAAQPQKKLTGLRCRMRRQTQSANERRHAPLPGRR